MHPHRPGKPLGLALILLGLLFFAGNNIGHWNVLGLAAAGTALLALSLRSARRRFAGLGAIALAVSAFLTLRDADLLGARADAWLFLLLAVAFLAVYILRGRWAHLYPISFALLLLVAAANNAFALSAVLGGEELLGKLSQWWPVLIILLGGLMLVGSRLRLATSTLLGPSAVLLAGTTAVLAVGAAAPGASWTETMFRDATSMHREVIEDSLDASRTTLVSVTNEGGNIRIYPSDSQQIHVQVVKQLWAPEGVDTEARLASRSLSIDRHDDIVEIRTLGSEAPWSFPFGSSSTTDIEVSVPAERAVRATSQKGRVKIDGVTGDVTVSTRTGNVELTNIGGNVRATSTAGNFEAHDIAGEINATTVSGNVEIVNAASLREVATDSGRVILDGIQRGTGTIRTTSGDVRLFVSPRSSFRLDFASISGDVRDDVSLKTELRDRNRLVGSYNEGENLLTIRTSSGSLRIMRSGS